ncbi:MAG: M23 family metallopeptidase [Candidatus Cloacimonetes bacterium]|nr:M23 family metallopeptidase [Candidatus Cloacimonadota bacterium]
MKKVIIFKIVTVAILVLIVITDFFIIKHLNKKLDNIIIITQQDNTPVFLPAKKIKEKTVLVTSDFVDTFNNYKSPFNDGLSFNELLKKYIRNRSQDHYGCKRGTSRCRRIHEGLDLFIAIDSPVYPLANYGIVTEVSDNPHFFVEVGCVKTGGIQDSMKVEYGKTVRILYPEGIESIYTHLNEVYVELGQEVNGDTKVGTTGRTGNVQRSSKPSHLHLELRDANNHSFDPRDRLRFNQGSLSNFLKYLDLERDK